MGEEEITPEKTAIEPKSRCVGLFEDNGLTQLARKLSSNSVQVISTEEMGTFSTGAFTIIEGAPSVAFADQGMVERGEDDGVLVHEYLHSIHASINKSLRERVVRMNNNSQKVNLYNRLEVAHVTAEMGVQAAVVLESPSKVAEMVKTARQRAEKMGADTTGFNLASALSEYYVYPDIGEQRDIASIKTRSFTNKEAFLLRLYENIYGQDDLSEEVFVVLQGWYTKMATISVSTPSKERFVIKEEANKYRYQIRGQMKELNLKIRQKLREMSKEEVKGHLKTIGGEDLAAALELEFFYRKIDKISQEDQKKAVESALSEATDLQIEEMAANMQIKVNRDPDKGLPSGWDINASDQIRPRQELEGEILKAANKGAAYIGRDFTWTIKELMMGDVRSEITEEIRNKINASLYDDWPVDFDSNSLQGREYVKAVEEMMAKLFKGEVWEGCTDVSVYHQPQIEYATGGIWSGETDLERASLEAEKQALMGNQGFYGHQNKRVGIFEGFEVLQSLANLEYFGIQHGESIHYGDGSRERDLNDLKARATMTAKDLMRFQMEIKKNKVVTGTLMEPFAFTIQKFIAGDKIGRYYPGFFGEGYSWTLSSFEAPQNYAALHLGIMKLLRAKNEKALFKFLEAEDLNDQIGVLKKHRVYDERANEVMAMVRGGKVKSPRALQTS